MVQVNGKTVTGKYDLGYKTKVVTLTYANAKVIRFTWPFVRFKINFCGATNTFHHEVLLSISESLFTVSLTS